jgi:hypothetical protein
VAGTEVDVIMTETSSSVRIAGLEKLIREAASRPDAPVDRWNPPYCGDIGLAIRADGSWTYRDSPIDRPALVKLFARVLRKDGDGRTFLVTPAEKIDVTVADAHFIAVEMDAQGEGRQQRLTFRTNLDDVAVAGPDHPIRFAVQRHTGGVKPYVHIRGRLEALVSRAVTFDLLQRLVPGDNPNDPLGLWSDGVFFPAPQQ